MNERLAWQASLFAASYDLTLWQDGQPRPITPTVQGLHFPSYDPPGDLATGVLYHWDVKAHNTSGSTQGPVWSFTTEFLPNRSVTSITVPPSAFSGQAFQVSWVIGNDGNAGTLATWRDRVYISNNSTFDP